MGKGETVREETPGAVSLTQGEVEPNSGGCESIVESILEGGDVDSSIIPNCLGMSDVGLTAGTEMSLSVLGTEAGLWVGGGLS